MDAYTYAREFDISEVTIAKFGGMTLPQLQELSIDSYFAIIEAMLTEDKADKSRG